MKADLFPADESIDLTVLLKTKREQKGWSLEEASKKTGIPIRYLEDIEQNSFRNFVGKAAALESYLRVYSNRLAVDVQAQKSLLEFVRNLLIPGHFNAHLIEEQKRGQ